MEVTVKINELKNSQASLKKNASVREQKMIRGGKYSPKSSNNSFDIDVVIKGNYNQFKPTIRFVP
jgi:hypothetical protein